MTPKEFERMQRLNMLKSLCFEDHALYSWTFEKDNGNKRLLNNPLQKLMQEVRRFQGFMREFMRIT